jgi:hypothetical protein
MVQCVRVLSSSVNACGQVEMEVANKRTGVQVGTGVDVEGGDGFQDTSFYVTAAYIHTVQYRT